MDQKELFKDNLRDTHWLGEVVDITDPEMLGRCRIRVFGKFDLLEVEDIPWAIPSNTSASGSYMIPNLGEIVSIYFDNGNIYTPVYKNQVNVGKEFWQDVLQGTNEPELATSLIYDAEKRFKIFHTQEDGIIITTGVGPDSQPMIRISNGGKIYLNADDIFISSSFGDESEPAVKGQTLTDYLKKIVETISSHTHLGGSGPVNPVSKLDMRFLKAKLDNIKQKSKP